MKIEMSSLNSQEAHHLITSAIAPLPIALISTIGEDGVYNAAPFSLVTPVCFKPTIICASFGLRQGQKKDTVRNIEFTNDFVVNIMGKDFIKPTIKTSDDYASNVDEIELVGLTATIADTVKSPLIAEAQVSLECQMVQSLEFGKGEYLRSVIFGEVVLAHVKDELLVDGEIEPSLRRAIGRLGQGVYCKVTDILRI